MTDEDKQSNNLTLVQVPFYSINKKCFEDLILLCSSQTTEREKIKQYRYTLGPHASFLQFAAEWESIFQFSQFLLILSHLI